MAEASCGFPADIGLRNIRTVGVNTLAVLASAENWDTGTVPSC